MNEAAVELLSDLQAIELALRAEGLGAVANHLRKAADKFEKGTAALGEPITIDWPAVADRLEAQAKRMHDENAALTATARNTPYGVMTGTGTIILSMLSEAIGHGIGRPDQERVDKILAMLRQDRSAHIMAKITGKPGAGSGGVTKG